MSAYADYLSRRGYLKNTIDIRSAKLEKYIASRNPSKPLAPITHIDELFTDEIVHLYICVVSNGKEQSLYGNFFVDAHGGLVPEGFDDDEVDVQPEDVANKERLNEKALKALTKEREDIWEAVCFLVGVVIQSMRLGPP